MRSAEVTTKRFYLPNPPVEHQWKFNVSFKPLNSVSIDTNLRKYLRQHQLEGVFFIYRCFLSCYDDHTSCGCIIADEMGLGKTLQTIAFQWTVMNASPYQHSAPLVKRCIILTPGSLVNNWKGEYKKWIKNKISHILFVSKNYPVSDLKKFNHCHTIVMSYEMFLSNINILNDFNFQLMVCDEAHRLKNSSNKLYQQIKQFKAHFKLLLTGTPIQNNIEELYALIELVDPNFRQNYSNLIDPNDDEKEKNQKLQDYTSAVMLGRTTSILDNILPPKTDHILVFKIDDNFKLLYSNLVNSILKKLEDNTKEIGSNFLHILVILRKLLNSPELLDHGDIEKLSEIGCRENFVKTSFKSPKVRAIQDLFQIIDKDKISDKVVIVSSFTKVLDLLQRLSQDYKFETSRLDGNTAMNKRMQIVNDFNNKETAQKVLLLSNKAGGVGLNLIGVSILILFDIDWNPSNDAQAIGRVWRPGQLKDVKIYRFITSGTLEEKMMQRQCSKRNTSDNFFDTCEFSSNKFDGSNLLKTAINLLSFNPDSNSYLHDQLDCSCTQGDEASDNIIMKENLSKQINQSSESRDSLLEITDSNFLIKRQKLEANPNSSLSEVRKWRHVKSNNVSRTYDDCFILAIQDSLNFCFSDN